MTIPEKLVRFADRVDKEKGPLRLLAMFYRDDAPPTWDLIVSAKKLHLDDWDDLEYLLDLLRKTLTLAEFYTLSRIIVFEARHPQTDEALKEINGRIGYMELRGDFVGFPIRADVIRAEPPGASPNKNARPRKTRRAPVRRPAAVKVVPTVRRRKSAPAS